MIAEAGLLPPATNRGSGGFAIWRLLSPIDRASEILFGLIMVLTFTSSLSASEAGRADVRAMLIGALGCNLAWGIIDAVMFLMHARAENALAERTVASVRTAADPAAGRRVIAGALPPALLPALTEADLERMRSHVAALTPRANRLEASDWLMAGGVFLLVFLCTLPVVLPFLIWRDPSAALSVSNAVAIASLFLTGFTLGKYTGRPWVVGAFMVVVGLVLVEVAALLGG